MARLGGRHGDLGCFAVSHFAQKNHIRGLAERSAQGGDIVFRVQTDLPLADNALFIPVEKFNRFLQRDDVAGAVFIDAVDDASLCGGFAAAGGAGNQHHAALAAGDVHHFFRDAQRTVIGNAERDDAYDGGEGARCL
jgi:hypothetical protein